MIFLTRQGNVTLGKIRTYTFRTSCYPFSTYASLKIKNSCRNAIDRNIIQGGADLLKIVKTKDRSDGKKGSVFEILLRSLRIL